ncbi:UDP-N-acetylglucosamine--LPS N-acetylglucosamine transferase [Paenibacillus sp. HJL G12]|uniref:UDP-N-acetylglucosamine--LPS N-acetylglucosamine transferase n=1 Tax=Paenibacillus dendrobii TaxID=2691084 RepID=A0A7X3IIF8_9BACL|nr:glycosyltransferase [Paenibacillus dendrobii]MWV44553.1 UDP-N-acetylglucosamine--LPS N-acetylglucosamine transferase [Paenibacillus dendrobii]
MRKKRVLLLSEGFGTGHTQAAYALAAGMKRLDPHLQCRVIELGKFLNPTMGPLILSAYRKTVSSSPKLVGMLYRKQYDKSLNRLTRLALHRIFYTQAAQVIKQLKPDLIVCTHPFPNAVISRLKRQGLHVPLITLITDYDVHGTWVNKEVNQYLVSTPRVKDLLLRRNVPSASIQVTGIPVHPNFWERADKNQLAVELGLKRMPTILIMSGGWGVSFNKEMINLLISWADQIQLVFCTGSNEKLLQKMKNSPVLSHPHIHLLGYTKNIDQWMDVSDLLITKPGGMTCTEGLAKGIPMLFYEVIPGQEEENGQYFVELGSAEMIHDPYVLHRWKHRLIHEYEQVERSRLKSLVSAEPGSEPFYCAQQVLELLKHEDPHLLSRNSRL